MAQFRNISGDTLWVATDRGLVECDTDTIIDVSDEFASTVYFQTGDTGETALFALVKADAPKTKTTIPSPEADPAI